MAPNGLRLSGAVGVRCSRGFSGALLASTRDLTGWPRRNCRQYCSDLGWHLGLAYRICLSDYSKSRVSSFIFSEVLLHPQHLLSELLEEMVCELARALRIYLSRCVSPIHQVGDVPTAHVAVTHP